jgi:HK97 family phage portal protein
VSLTRRRPRREITGPVPEGTIPPRPASGRFGTFAVTPDSALRHSAVWACLRLRANMVSSMPLDAFRKLNGMQVEITKRPVLINPGGERVDMQEWLWSSQFDLDRVGNCFGLITEWTGDELPARIELQPTSSVVVYRKSGKLGYRIGGKEYPPEQVWHERQYTLSGVDVGLSPVAHAAYVIGEYMTVQDFALDWFGGGAVPKAHLKNTARKVNPKEASEVKESFKAAIATDGLFVHGSDWEYDMIQSDIAASSWLDMKPASSQEVARYFDCPADLIDAMTGASGGRVTYQNIVQRNIQFLILHLSPAISRRENALSKLLPQPRFVKFNTNALLRLDDEARARFLQLMITSRIYTPDEAREKENLPPLTQDQIDLFLELWPTGKSPVPTIPATFE